MAGLAFLKSPDLPPIADVYANEDDFRNGIPPIVDGAPGADMNEMKNNFFEVYTAVATMVERAIDDLDAVRFRLEGARVRMHQVRSIMKKPKIFMLLLGMLKMLTLMRSL